METAVCCTLTGAGALTADCSEDQRPPEARRRGGAELASGHYYSRTIYKCERRVVQLYLNSGVPNKICKCVKESLNVY